MNLSKLSKRDQFFDELGQAMSMNNMRCLINLDTLEVIIYGSEEDDWLDEEEEEADEVDEKMSSGQENEDKEDFSDPKKFMRIEPVTSHEAFEIMEQFADSVNDKHMRQRLFDALSGRKPFANFNGLVHQSAIREQWFNHMNKAYMQLAKEWINYAADKNLKEKINALPSVRLAD